jgi:hypothetical protein
MDGARPSPANGAVGRCGRIAGLSHARNGLTGPFEVSGTRSVPLCPRFEPVGGAGEIRARGKQFRNPKEVARLALSGRYKTPRIQPSISAFLRSCSSILGEKNFSRLLSQSRVAIVFQAGLGSTLFRSRREERRPLLFDLGSATLGALDLTLLMFGQS